MCVLCLYAKVFCIVYSRSFLPPPSVFLSHEVELLICVLGVLIMCYSICWQNLDETSFFSHSCNSTEWKKAELGFLLCTQIRLLLCGRLYLRPSMGMWNFRVSGQGTDLQCSRLDCWLFFASYKVKYKLPTSNIHFLHWWHRKKFYVIANFLESSIGGGTDSINRLYDGLKKKLTFIFF